MRIARAEAIATRHSNIIMCVLQTEEDLGFYDNAINSLDADKESVVTFGPWKAAPSVQDLLDSIKMDIESQGYRVSIQPHSTDKGFLFKSYDYFYRITFTWWWFGLQWMQAPVADCLECERESYQWLHATMLEDKTTKQSQVYLYNL